MSSFGPDPFAVRAYFFSQEGDPAISQIVSIKTEVRDAAAIHAACKRLNLPDPVHIKGADMAGKAKSFAELDKNSTTDTNPDVAGTRIFNRAGDGYGISVGISGSYIGEAGNSDRIRVIWPSGKPTNPVLAGIWFRNGHWQIV